jgi:hypothetical protein
MLADDAIKPALEPARQREIGPIDCQNERILDDARVEPVRQNQFDAERPPVGVGRFRPLVDPGEAVAATFGHLPDRGRDRGRLEPVEAGLETLVVACAGAAANEGEDLVWRRRHQAGGAQASVARVNDLRGCPDQHIGVPDGRHAMFRHGHDADRDRARPEIDRHEALRLGEREEWIGHQILRIAWREIAGERSEEIELFAP